MNKIGFIGAIIIVVMGGLVLNIYLGETAAQTITQPSQSQDVQAQELTQAFQDIYLLEGFESQVTFSLSGCTFEMVVVYSRACSASQANSWITKITEIVDLQEIAEDEGGFSISGSDRQLLVMQMSQTYSEALAPLNSKLRSMRLNGDPSEPAARARQEVMSRLTQDELSRLNLDSRIIYRQCSIPDSVEIIRSEMVIRVADSAELLRSRIKEYKETYCK